MEKGTKGSRCVSASHRLMKDNVKNRLNDLQQKFSDFQAARKEGRIGDVAVLEEQMYQDLREWKTELDAPSPASSLRGDSLGSFSDDIARLLQLYEEEDDATSGLAKHSTLKPELGLKSNFEGLNLSNITTFQDDYLLDINPQELAFEQFDQPINSPLGLENLLVSTSDTSNFWDSHQYIFDDGFNHGLSISTIDKCEKDADTSFPCTPPSASPPPSAFMGPKCALWDCTRPAKGSELYKDYCSSFHCTLALNEGLPGMNPVLRPSGIGLKDTLLFYTVTAKTEGKNVGIPQCEGAASMKSPWNAGELFDLSLLEGETVREWLFFDKPRKAFDSGNRKQRSLPDYKGRGWHESRKQVMKEFGGQKRSYYMDPQPQGSYEWHLYEYEINNSDTCALYRLELKLVDGRKTPKGKSTKDSLADLQKRMGRLTADGSPSDTGRMKAIKEARAEDVNLSQDQKTSNAGSLVHGLEHSSCNY